MNTHPSGFFNHFFPATFERARKHIQLPAGIDTNRDIILNILHNHHLLVQNIWPSFTIKSISSAPDTTVFALEKPVFIAYIKKATFTSFDGGVTTLEELGSSGIKAPAQSWRPVRPATAPGHYSLEESLTVSGDRLLSFLSRFDDGDGYDRNTERLLEFLARIAARKVSMSDVSEENSEQQYFDAAKLKND
ncbi:uncharacterized protein ASPGLDRAFT_59890 [Aspergillus glaucus CBS 516.65]|uniref:Uncharacterized protein n=1 Tax=Aspergillus glaucus CBS 516.65 TaxID=1160497 RepID=A0A1L9VD41_ASPGL|nr:hypothetical protein ASPGLDRAFT_59890 [Aspergillus glaucus CBS 516.65]OJJ81881.1 hypothetical protein ASPGLDRAFT_59890 [Aspergillus glaucus CBS 516.65]